MKIINTNKLLEDINNVGAIDDETISQAPISFVSAVKDARKQEKEIEAKLDKHIKETTKDLDDTEKDRIDGNKIDRPEGSKKLHLEESLFTEDKDSYSVKDYLESVIMGEGWVGLEKIEFDIQEASYPFKVEDVVKQALKDGWKLEDKGEGYSIVFKNSLTESYIDDGDLNHLFFKILNRSKQYEFDGSDLILTDYNLGDRVGIHLDQLQDYDLDYNIFFDPDEDDGEEYEESLNEAYEGKEYLIDKVVESQKEILENHIIPKIEGKWTSIKQFGPIKKEDLLYKFDSFHTTPSGNVYAIFNVSSHYIKENGEEDSLDFEEKISIDDFIKGKLPQSKLFMKDKDLNEAWRDHSQEGDTYLVSQNRKPLADLLQAYLIRGEHEWGYVKHLDGSISPTPLKGAEYEPHQIGIDKDFNIKVTAKSEEDLGPAKKIADKFHREYEVKSFEGRAGAGKYPYHLIIKLKDEDWDEPYVDPEAETYKGAEIKIKDEIEDEEI